MTSSLQGCSVRQTAKEAKRYEGGVSLTTQKDWQHCSNRFKSGKFAQAKHDASDHKEVVSASVCVCCVCVGGLAAGCLQLDHTTVVVVDRVLNTSIVSRASPRGDKCTDWGFWVVLAVRQRLNTLHFHQNHQTLNSKKVSGSRYIAAFSLTGFCSAVFFQGTSCILSHSVWPCQRKELLLAVTTKAIWRVILCFKGWEVAEKRGERGREGDSGEEVGKREGGGGGVGDFSLTFSNTHTHTLTLPWLCGQLPWENPRSISRGGAFRAEVGHMAPAANWMLVIWFKLW